jgi:U2 small nuclear ribonucleoprotein A'
MRINVDLIAQSSQYMNAAKERELDLRGVKAPAIENMGATNDQFDSIDLSDNEVRKLDGFPLLRRLGSLLLNNNRIAKIGANVSASLPNLHTLILSGNNITKLSDLDDLTQFDKLAWLSLLNNPVAKEKDYRLYTISRCPALKVLDFSKVKTREREEAKRLFPDDGPATKKAKTFTPGEGVAPAKKQGPTPEQILAIKARIASAQTIEEVQVLEKALRSGMLPSDMLPQGEEGEAAAEQ